MRVVMLKSNKSHNSERFKMDKDTRFVVKFNSRCDAMLFYNAVQKQLKKEQSYNGFTEYDHVNHWVGNGGLIVTVYFKDPMTMEEAKELSFGCDAEWELLPSSYTFEDLLNLEWS